MYKGVPRIHFVLVLLFVAILGTGLFFGYLKRAKAADGSGTMTVTPTTAQAGSNGNTLTFTFTASETMDSGGIRMTVPANWSSPQSISGTAGYTTVNSAAGIIATVINILDNATNWTATNNHMALAIDTSDKQEGTSALSNTIGALASANEQWYYNYGSAANWGTTAAPSNALHIGLFLKTDANTASGDLSWQDDDTANLGSPLDTIALPALSANTWTYTSVALGSASRASILSYGFRYTTDIGAGTVKADSLSVIFQENDSNNGWSGDSGISDTLITGTGNFKEGTGAVRCTYAASAGTGSSGECWDNENSAAVRGPGTTISFWVRPSIALNAGDFAWVDDDSANLGSPLDVVSLPALSANTWTYVTLSAPNSASLRSFGIRQVIDKGAMTIDLDAVGKIFDAADSTSGWTAPSAVVQTLSADTATYHEGTASLKNVIGSSASAGETWYQTLSSAQDWSGYTTIGFWIRSSVATAAGNLQLQYASSNDLTSPIATLNIGALAANTWTYQKLTLSGTRSNINSYGIKYATDLGAATMYLDDILIGPGIPTFPGGNAVDVRILQLAGSQTITITYGAGGGTSGATAPSTGETSTFTTQSRSSDNGALVAIGSSPTVTVQAAPTINSFTASPSSIQSGNTSTLSWTTSNGTSASIDQGIGSVATSGSQTVSPTATTTYTLTVTGPGGTTTGSVTVNVSPAPVPAPTISSFSASPVTINSGESSTLSWSTTNATSASIDQGIGSVATSGSQTVSPTATTTYTLTATGPGGTATANTTVNVRLAVSPLPTISFSATPSTIDSGQSSTLAWSTTNATTVSIDQGIGSVATSGSQAVSPTSDTTYTITATGPGGTQTASVLVVVTPPLPGAPTINSFTITPATITAGENATLSWTTTDSTTTTIDQGIGTVASTGSTSVSPTETTTYTLTAANAGGTRTASVTLSVSAASVAAPTPAEATANSSLRQSTANFSGKAFPGAKVTLLEKLYEQNIILAQGIPVEETGNFKLWGIPTGYHAYGLIVKDEEGRSSATKLFNRQFINDTFAVENIVMSPTVEITPPAVTQGKKIAIIGSAYPNSHITLEIDGSRTFETTANDKGAFMLEIETSDLAIGSHTVRAKQSISESEVSDFSLARTFSNSASSVVKADFNDDGIINIKDWSIFLSNWKQTTPQAKQLIDLNGDGKATISDISIFLKAFKK